jgi:Phospholipase_D-nuclease N-terminal
MLCVAAAVLGVVLLSLLPAVLVLLGFSLAALVFVFWIWMLVDAIKNQGLGEGEKIGWVLAIVFLHVIGSLLYFFIGRPKRNVTRLT